MFANVRTIQRMLLHQQGQQLLYVVAFWLSVSLITAAVLLLSFGNGRMTVIEFLALHPWTTLLCLYAALSFANIFLSSVSLRWIRGSTADDYAPLFPRIMRALLTATLIDVLLVPAFVLGIAPGILLQGRLNTAPIIAAFEKATPVHAIRKSWNRTTGETLALAKLALLPNLLAPLTAIAWLISAVVKADESASIVAKFTTFGIAASLLVVRYALICTNRSGAYYFATAEGKAFIARLERHRQQNL